ncbi:retrovirus-related pol polyprotein from transposon TNT 1-94 [Tanacetum coccineum]|uniref:Retrovirus-related pol polyprotein from transposon TNT 1-94 n=1 Tax=Tanacetum coccineum TaxID=301880 RepID=A0ABQ5BM44_9ASTR
MSCFKCLSVKKKISAYWAYFDIVVPPMVQNCLAKILNLHADREHIKFLNLKRILSQYLRSTEKLSALNWLENTKTESPCSKGISGSSNCSMVSGFWMLKTYDRDSIGYGVIKWVDTSSSRVFYVEGLKHTILGRTFACLQKPLHEVLVYGIVGFESSEFGNFERNWLEYLWNDLLQDLDGKISSNKAENSQVIEKFICEDSTSPYMLTVRSSKQIMETELNGVVERQNQTLMEAARTMLIFAKAPLFLWAEAVATACYTLNRSLVHTLHGKTYYELLKGKKPNLQYFRVFGSLCYPTNDYDDVGKLKAKADIGLTSVQTSSGLAPQQMTSVPNSTELELTALQSGRSRSALVKDPEPPSVPPTKKQVDDLFQWFDDDEVVPIPPVVPITPVNVPAAPAPENAIGSPSTTVISEGAPAVTESLLPHQIPLPDTNDI